MRARLTKLQMQMLLDGKPITHGRRMFGLPADGALDIKELLCACVRDDEFRKACDVLVDLRDNTLVVNNEGLSQWLGGGSK